MTITNLVPGTKYAFVVMAETYCGYGGNSSIAQGSTKVDGKLWLCERFFVQLWYPLKLPTKGNCVCVESWRQRNPPVITLNEKISQKQNKQYIYIYIYIITIINREGERGGGDPTKQIFDNWRSINRYKVQPAT